MAIDLNKRIETVKIILAKKQLPDVKAQVGVAFDISGSMQNLYANGTVQDAAERILALACRFDDNQNLDAWTFNNSMDELEAITMENYSTFVKKEILNNSKVDKWGGTSLAPVMSAIVSQYFSPGAVAAVSKKIFGLFGGSKAEPASTPTAAFPSYAIIITDGENDDRAETIRLIEANSKNNIYWQFVGIGSTRFNFLTEIADKYPNVGLVTISDLATVSDDTLYTQLLNDEFCDWVKAH